MDEALPPGSYDTNTLSKVYVDGLELDALVDALEENQRIIGAQKSVSEQQFWSSPRRAESDTTREVYEVSLNASRRVNAMAFDLARFPQRWYLFYRSGSSGRWLPLLAKNKRAITGSISDSVPAVLTPPPPGSTEHPQHYGAGHWVRKEYDLNPVIARQFRLVLVRQKSAKAPTDRAKKKVPYSLGVRGFEVGYKVKGRDDVPLTPRNPVIVSERESFATTTDILGSPVSLSVRENRASDLLRGAVWKSEPQPIPNAVVNLYVDARDGLGQAQVIDRFYLDPTTSGVSMNIYFSNDTPDQVRFSASDDPLDFPMSRANGAVTVANNGLRFPDAFGYIDLDNAGVQFNPLRPFWLGMTLNPAFASDDVDAHPFLDTGTLRIEWADSALRVFFAGTTVTYSRTATAEDEASETTIPPLFGAGEELPFVVGYDGTNLVLYIDGVRKAKPVINPVRVAQPQTATGLASYLRIGGYAVADGGDPGHGNFRLTSMILKSEPPAEAEVLDALFADPVAFIDGGQEPPSVDTSDNALVRYLVKYQTSGAGSLNPLGFIGGPGNRYEDLVWTPINRDFRLAKGYVVFNPTLAKYFKFEFTNLVAQPYDDYAPIARRAKVFPTAMVYRRAVSSSNNTVRGAVPAANSAASTLFFSDQARLYSVSRPIQPDPSYVPTIGVYSTDPKVAERLRGHSIYMNLQAWHSRVFAPRFVDVQKHVYETVEVVHTARVAYFVGLSRIEMSRVDYIVDDDTEQYLEPFFDAANMVVDETGTPVGGWSLDGGWLATPDTLGVNEVVQATSKVFASRRKVTAIQFATQQTPPVQILPDPDLDDKALVSWRGFGDARITASDEFATDIGTMALVQRDSSANFWTVIEDRYSSWDEMESVGLTWDALEASGASNPQGGLASAGFFDVSSEGRLYAAARVYATEDLTAPLYVQVVSEGGSVLSEEAIDVRAGQVAEWYTSYTIGEGGSLVAQTWDDVEAVGTWDLVQALGTWDQVAQTSLDNIGRISARIVQTEPTSDSWYVDNLSLFDDGIVWEFSRDGGVTFYPAYDIRNDPHGVFVFPKTSDPNAGLGLVWRVKGTRGNQRVDYLALRPWYDSLPMGQPYRETIQVGGPNQALIDHYPPITEDPRWKVWNKPIPEEWWFVFRQWLLEQRPEPVADTTIVVPNSIVPVDEGLYVEPGLELVQQASLQSDLSDVYVDGGVTYTNPNNSLYYPFGPTATAILDDGTYFVAVQMNDNSATPGPGFVRMWHLAEDLTVLGTHDEPYVGGVTRVGGNPGPFATAMEDGKVLLSLFSPYDKTTNYYALATGPAMIDTGSAFVTASPGPDATFEGTPASLTDFSSSGAFYVRVNGTSTASAATDLVTPSGTLTTLSANPALLVTKAQLRMQVWASEPEPITWKISDASAPYGTGVVATGTLPYLPAINDYTNQYFPASEWRFIQADLPLTTPELAALRTLLVGDKVRVSLSVGDSGERRVSAMSLLVDYGVSV